MSVSKVRNESFHALGCVRRGASCWEVRVDLLACYGIEKGEELWICRGGGMFWGGWEEELVANRAGEGYNFDVMGEF